MKIVAAALLVVMCMPCIALGDDSLKSIRCKAGLVDVGANKLEVLQKCGEPVHKDVIEASSKRSKYDYAEIQEWVYNFGSMDFIYTLRLEGSTLVEIKRGGRGF
jgi:hypothetical protein